MRWKLWCCCRCSNTVALVLLTERARLTNDNDTNMTSYFMYTPAHKPQFGCAYLGSPHLVNKWRYKRSHIGNALIAFISFINDNNRCSLCKYTEYFGAESSKLLEHEMPPAPRRRRYSQGWCGSRAYSLPLPLADRATVHRHEPQNVITPGRRVGPGKQCFDWVLSTNKIKMYEDEMTPWQFSAAHWAEQSANISVVPMV